MGSRNLYFFETQIARGVWEHISRKILIFTFSKIDSKAISESNLCSYNKICFIKNKNIHSCFNTTTLVRNLGEGRLSLPPPYATLLYLYNPHQKSNLVSWDPNSMKNHTSNQVSLSQSHQTQLSAVFQSVEWTESGGLCK